MTMQISSVSAISSVSSQFELLSIVAFCSDCLARSCVFSSPSTLISTSSVTSDSVSFSRFCSHVVSLGLRVFGKTDSVRLFQSLFCEAPFRSSTFMMIHIWNLEGYRYSKQSYEIVSILKIYLLSL